MEQKHVFRFLIVTFLLSFTFEAYVISIGGIRTWPQSTLILMWIPGVVSLLYRFFTKIGFSDVGFKLGKFKYWALAAGVPLLIATVSNLLCWATGINEFVPYPEEILKKVGVTSIAGLIFLKYPWWLLWGNINALGEELGWRGFLIPKLIHFKMRHPFIVSGIIWGIWHYPLILWGGYATSEYPIISVLLFTVMIIYAGVFVAWLRMKSGSVWVAMFYHACHNLFLQTVFAVFSKPGKLDPYLGNESGLIPCLLYILIIFFGQHLIKTNSKLLA